MSLTTKLLVIPMLTAAGVSCAAAKPSSAERSAGAGRYVERTCDFGRYGPITIHEGGLGDTYIVVHGKKYPSIGGENFVQSNDDDNVAVMFDRKGEPSYRGETPGRNCRVSRR